VTRAVPERKSRLRRLALGRGAASLALGCALIAGLKLWLVADDEVVARAIPHDHQRYAEMAFEIVHGRWLGDYDHMTLIREPAYPVWIAGVHATGVPLRLAAEVLLAASAALFVAALRLAGAPTALALGCFGLLVLQPHSFLVNRELLAAGFYLPVLLIAVSGLLLAARAASLRHRAVHAVWTGLALGALWTTRPEKPLVVVVIAAFALLDLARRRAGGATWRRAVGPVGVPVMGAVLGIATAAMGFSALNHRHYGMFVTSDLSAPGFVAANAALLGIEQAAPRRFVLVPRDVRERAYAASPAFHELRPWLEAPSAGRSVSCNLVNVCDDFAGCARRRREPVTWILRSRPTSSSSASPTRSHGPASAVSCRPSAQTCLRSTPVPRPTSPIWPDRSGESPGALPCPASGPTGIRSATTSRHRNPSRSSSTRSRTGARGSPNRIRPASRDGRRSRAIPPNGSPCGGRVWGAGSWRTSRGNRSRSGRFACRGCPAGGCGFASTSRTAPAPSTRWSRPSSSRARRVRRRSFRCRRPGIRRALWRAHALGVRVLTLLGVVAAALLVLPPWRGRRPDLVVEALGLILVIVVARVAMLTALDAGSFPAWSSRYVYPVVSLTSCGLLLLVFEALRHHTRRAVAK
jgi:hypothetical protein